ncbi:fimbrial protein FimV [Acinetobacter indicus]|uniref:fimbrial protein FimV n=1 Tax=Acinetobacter indicus TaxID=756892 RepID=UPI000CEBC0AF|nr:fimbrial protein FimV [Acinetobacter indicus]
MLIYVIPFILLLVIALVLKKREANKESEPAAKKPAAASKTKAKKSTTTKKTTVKTAVVAEPVAEPQGSTPLPADLRQTIETQIRDRNFFSAEAQINQALKRDPSLHELYLLLLDVHLTQKDEFATRQLLDHLKNLGLEDILAQANAKVDAQKAPQAKEELIEFTPATPVAVQATPAEKAQTTADFDALIQSSSSSTSFDQLQQSLKTETPAEAKTEELPALDLEFTPSTPAAPVNTPAPAKTEEVQPLEFNLSFDSAASTQVAAPVTPVEPVTPAAQEPQALDFSFELEKTATEATPATTPAVTTPPAEEKSEFNFDFSISPTPVAEQPVEPAVTAPTDTAPLFQFDLDSAPTIEATPATPEAPMVEEPAMAAVAATAVDPHDPLIQSFPELAEVNEIQLNLELAQQYIELGAYDAARALLAEKEANYSTAQQQHATQLLNQIAS